MRGGRRRCVELEWLIRRFPEIFETVLRFGDALQEWLDWRRRGGEKEGGLSGVVGRRFLKSRYTVFEIPDLLRLECVSQRRLLW